MTLNALYGKIAITISLITLLNEKSPELSGLLFLWGQGFLFVDFELIWFRMPGLFSMILSGKPCIKIKTHF